MVIKLSKKVKFLQICADLRKKSKFIKAIHIYASERSLHALSEKGILTILEISWFETDTFC